MKERVFQVMPLDHLRHAGLPVTLYLHLVMEKVSWHVAVALWTSAWKGCRPCRLIGQIEASENIEIQ